MHGSGQQHQVIENLVDTCQSPHMANQALQPDLAIEGSHLVIMQPIDDTPDPQPALIHAPEASSPVVSSHTAMPAIPLLNQQETTVGGQSVCESLGYPTKTHLIIICHSNNF